jgi:DNA-binding LacI/PurR family transcriptional regulator
VLADTPYDLIIHNVATPEQRADCFKRFPTRQVDGVLIIAGGPRRRAPTPTGRRADCLHRRRPSRSD